MEDDMFISEDRRRFWFMFERRWELGLHVWVLITAMVVADFVNREIAWIVSDIQAVLYWLAHGRKEPTIHR